MKADPTTETRSMRRSSVDKARRKEIRQREELGPGPWRRKARVCQGREPMWMVAREQAKGQNWERQSEVGMKAFSGREKHTGKTLSGKVFTKITTKARARSHVGRAQACSLEPCTSGSEMCKAGGGQTQTGSA